MPIGMPTSAATTALARTSTKVCGNMRPMYSLTGYPWRKEVPKSKRTDRQRKSTYCTASGRSSPRFFAQSARACGGRLAAHHRHAGVAGQDAHREEHDAHRPEEHRDGDEHPTQDVLEHG